MIYIYVTTTVTTNANNTCDLDLVDNNEASGSNHQRR